MIILHEQEEMARKVTEMILYDVNSDELVSQRLSENYFSYFSTKTHVVGIQKNRLNETVLLSTQNTCLN